MIYLDKYKPVYPEIDWEASSKYIDDEEGTITYTGDCEWRKFLDEQYTKGNYDLIECVAGSALR